MKEKSVSIILTIHNQENIIKSVIKSILDNKSNHTKELIIVFDGCNDKSEEYSKEILSNVKDINIIYEYAPNLFETKSNNIALKKSTCNYSMIIQDDMIIEEEDFDKRMLKPFIFGDTFAVTARLAHNDVLMNGMLGWRDHAGYDPYNKQIWPSMRNHFSIRDVCNRGPLLLDNEKLIKLNYLDEAFSPQGLDDHDICLKAWKNYKWVSGSYWIKWGSDAKWGGTRKNIEVATYIQKAEDENKKILINRYSDILHPDNKHNEQRFIL